MTKHRIEIATLMADTDYVRLFQIGVRHKLEDDFKVVDGRCTAPGQFEGEPVHVPYYWDMYLAGLYDHEVGELLKFYVLPEERKVFPELKRRKVVWLVKDEQGFVREVHPR